MFQVYKIYIYILLHAHCDKPGYHLSLYQVIIMLSTVFPILYFITLWLIYWPFFLLFPMTLCSGGCSQYLNMAIFPKLFLRFTTLEPHSHLLKAEQDFPHSFLKLIHNCGPVVILCLFFLALSPFWFYHGKLWGLSSDQRAKMWDGCCHLFSASYLCWRTCVSVRACLWKCFVSYYILYKFVMIIIHIFFLITNIIMLTFENANAESPKNKIEITLY